MPLAPLRSTTTSDWPIRISNETFRNLNESRCHVFVFLKPQPCFCFVVGNNSQRLKWRSGIFSCGVFPQSIHVICSPSISSSLTRHKKVSYFGCRVPEVGVTSEFLSLKFNVFLPTYPLQKLIMVKQEFSS